MSTFDVRAAEKAVHELQEALAMLKLLRGLRDHVKVNPDGFLALFVCSKESVPGSDTDIKFAELLIGTGKDVSSKHEAIKAVEGIILRQLEERAAYYEDMLGCVVRPK